MSHVPMIVSQTSDAAPDAMKVCRVRDSNVEPKTFSILMFILCLWRMDEIVHRCIPSLGYIDMAEDKDMDFPICTRSFILISTSILSACESDDICPYVLLAKLLSY